MRRRGGARAARARLGGDCSCDANGTGQRGAARSRAVSSPAPIATAETSVRTILALFRERRRRATELFAHGARPMCADGEAHQCPGNTWRYSCAPNNFWSATHVVTPKGIVFGLTAQSWALATSTLHRKHLGAMPSPLGSAAFFEVVECLSP